MKLSIPLVKRVKSKLSKELAGSPYTPMGSTKHIYKSSVSLSHKKSSSQIQENFTDCVSKFVKRHSTMNLDTRMLEEEKSKYLEKLLYERLENIAPHKEFKSEIQVLDSIYSEIATFFNKFERILMILREKLESCISKSVEDQLSYKIENVKKLNENLVKKINTLSDMHQLVVEENEKMKSELSEYNRMFKENPKFVVNFQNIVDKMLDQCKVIDKLNAEIKRLRKGKMQDSIKIAELKLRKKPVADISF